MPGGKGNVQSANPPPDLEPGISAITKTHEAQKEAEDKPGQQHHQRGFQEDSL